MGTRTMSDTPAITFQPLGPGPTFSNQNVWLPLLVWETARRGQLILENLSFDTCLIEGPAVILPMEGCAFDGCNFGDAEGDPRVLALRPMSGDRVTGVVAFRNCSFKNCNFVGVGFTGSETFLDGMVKALGGAPQ